MSLKKSLLFLVLIISFLNDYSQTPTLDSLKHELKNAEHDTLRCEILAQLSNEEENINIWQAYNTQLKEIAEKNLKSSSLNKYLEKIYKGFLATAYNNTGYIMGMKGDQAKNMEYLQKALSIATEIKDTSEINIALNSMAVIHHSQGDLPSAIELFKKCLVLAESSGNIDQQGVILNNLAINHEELGEISKAFDYAYKALKLKEMQGDELETAKTIFTIANFYENQKDYDKALEFMFKSLKIYERKNSTIDISECLHNIGTVYENQTNFPKALEYFSKSLKICESINYQRGIAGSLNAIGNLHYKSGNKTLAKDFFIKHLSISESLGDRRSIVTAWKQIAVVCYNDGNIAKALEYGNKSLELAKKIKTQSGIQAASEILIAIYKKQGNYRKALEMHELNILTRDSINNSNFRKTSMKKQFQYEYDKKEAEVKAASRVEKEKIELKAAEDKKRQNMIIYSVITGLLLVSIFSAFIFRGLQKNKKANKIIMQQNKIVEEKNHLIEEKQKEIIDSINYAQRIQRSLLASKDLLDQNLGDYFILFKPKDIVSGDFYWAAKLKNNHFAIVTADSTGHGVPGAIMSMLNIACLNEAISNGFTSPNDILFETRLRVIEHLKNDGSATGGKDGMDCSLLCIDNEKKILYVAAANNPVWIIRASTNSTTSEIIEIKPDKMPVGKHDRDNEPFTLHTIQLQKNDTIYTLTDGFPDQFGGEKGKKFMSKNLKELLKANTHLPIVEQKQILETAFTNWVGRLEQIDDVTIIGIKV